MTYTPGPWQFTTNMIGINNMRVFGVEEINDDFTQGIANCGYGEGSEANARLIAAAPELLAALQSLVELLADDESHMLPEEHLMIGNAREAIAKATREEL